MNQASPPPFFVPFPRPDLIGREEALERLHATLQRRDAAVTPALVGQGGIGKTQLAVRYAWDYGGHWPGGVFWFNAAHDAEGPVVQFAQFAYRMGLLGPAIGGDTAQVDRRFAELWVGQVGSRRDALLLADNLEDRRLLTAELPGLPNARLSALGCRLLVTSRERGLPRCADVPVDLLGPAAARTLLLREAEREDTDADRAAAEKIGALLGGLPLALRLAGALLKQSPDVSLDRFARVLRANGAIRVLDAAGVPLDNYGKDMPLSLAALFSQSWNALPDGRPELKEILRALGCLPETQVIRVGLLRCLVDCPPDPLGLRDTLRRALDELFKRNLLERPNENHVRLHPLLHEYARQQGKDGLSAMLMERATHRLRSPDYLATVDAEELLTLLRELPMLEAMADGRG